MKSAAVKLAGRDAADAARDLVAQRDGGDQRLARRSCRSPTARAQRPQPGCSCGRSTRCGCRRTRGPGTARRWRRRPRPTLNPLPAAEDPARPGRVHRRASPCHRLRRTASASPASARPITSSTRSLVLATTSARQVVEAAARTPSPPVVRSKKASFEPPGWLGRRRLLPDLVSPILSYYCPTVRSFDTPPAVPGRRHRGRRPLAPAARTLIRNQEEHHGDQPVRPRARSPQGRTRRRVRGDIDQECGRLQPAAAGAGHRVLLGRGVDARRPAAQDPQPAQPGHAGDAEPPARAGAAPARRACATAAPRRRSARCCCRLRSTPACRRQSIRSARRARSSPKRRPSRSSNATAFAGERW